MVGKRVQFDLGGDQSPASGATTQLSETRGRGVLRSSGKIFPSGRPEGAIARQRRETGASLASIGRKGLALRLARARDAAHLRAMVEPGLISLVVILGIAMVVAIVARRLRLPYTVGLVLVGALLALSHAAPPISFTYDIVYFVILPPLLFEAALALRWSLLRADLLPILLLSTVGRS